jgi:hypothetical protein
MKKILIILFFIKNLSSVDAQQFLWTTQPSTTVKTIPLEQVVPEVMGFYENYQCYQDGTGFSKDGFIAQLQKNRAFYGMQPSELEAFKTNLMKIEKLVIYAFKTNSGKGSSITVMCIGKSTVDYVHFQNEYESNFIFTVDAEKFANWFYMVSGVKQQEESINTNSLPGSPTVLDVTSKTNDSPISDPYHTMVVTDAIVDDPQIKANFPGGDRAFLEYFKGEFVYSPSCLKQDVNLVVKLRFAVDEAGRISRIRVLDENLDCPDYTYETIRVLMKSPRWVPGQTNGRFLKSWREVTIALPIPE